MKGFVSEENTRPGTITLEMVGAEAVERLWAKISPKAGVWSQPIAVSPSRSLQNSAGSSRGKRQNQMEKRSRDFERITQLLTVSIDGAIYG